MVRKSSIDTLPQRYREVLNEMLRDPAVTQLEATKRLNTMLEEDDREERVYKSSVNRYSQRMDAIGEKMRQSRQIADMWIGKLGNQPQGQVGKLLNEFTRTMAFETALQMSEDKEPPHPKLLKELSLAIKHLEEAASTNEKREREIRRQMAEEAATAVDEAAKQQGLTADSVAQIKAQILGIA